MIKAYINWSGGKDSSLCLYQVLQEKQYHITHLLTSVNAAHNRISMHGVRRGLLLEQARALGIPLHTIELPEQPGMKDYEEAMMEKVRALKQEGCTHAVFGDIFLEDLRAYREKKLEQQEVSCVFPLWKKPTDRLMKDFLGAGFRSVVVCVNEKFLDKSFCGRIIDESFVNDLPANVDVCGENGEYHSFVFDGPLFSQPIPYAKGEIVYRKYEAPKNGDNCTMDQPSQHGFYFCDLLPSQ